MQYKLQKNFRSGEVCSITIVGQNIAIPIDESNTDYQAFLRWCEAGNQPEAADEIKGE